jgi:hypothetical protein
MHRLRICRPCRSGCLSPTMPRRIPGQARRMICNSFMGKVLQKNQLHQMEIAAMCRIGRRVWQRSSLFVCPRRRISARPFSG